MLTVGGGLSLTKLSQVHRRARDLGKDSFMLAFLLDSHKEEQERGICMFFLFFFSLYPLSLDLLTLVVLFSAKK